MSPALQLAFYGDDFTGSTDAMEALALSGLRTVLFFARQRRRDCHALCRSEMRWRGGHQPRDVPR